MADRIEKSIDLKVPAETLWQAITDYKQFGEWFRVKLEGPFAVGHEVKGHITYPGYEHLKWKARIRHMEDARLFSFTWHPYAINPDDDYSHESPTLVEFRLEPITGGTRLIIIETGFDDLPEARKRIAYQKHEEGWNEQLWNIQAYLEKSKVSA